MLELRSLDDFTSWTQPAYIIDETSRFSDLQHRPKIFSATTLNRPKTVDPQTTPSDVFWSSTAFRLPRSFACKAKTTDYVYRAARRYSLLARTSAL